MGFRPSSARAPEKEKGYTTDESTLSSVQGSRSYSGRGRGRRGPNYTSGYGEFSSASALLNPELSLEFVFCVVEWNVGLKM